MNKKGPITFSKDIINYKASQKSKPNEITFTEIYKCQEDLIALLKLQIN